MTDSTNDTCARFDELPRPAIKVKATPRDRGSLIDLIIEDGARSFCDAIDIREEKNRARLIKNLTRRWPDLKDDAPRADHVRSELERIAGEFSRTAIEFDGDYPPEISDEPPTYSADEQGLFWNKPTRDGWIEIRLTNFQATIVCEVTCDDGVTKSKYFEIECVFGEVRRTIRLSVEEFMRMNWPVEHLGAGAIVYAGMGTKDHARTAIQVLSTSVIQRTVYRHLGWAKVEGRPAFLHAGGALGATNIEVEVEPQLAEFVLPTVPVGSELHEAIRASLRFLKLAKLEITAPIFTAIYRSVIPVPTDFSMWVHGPSGVMKSEIAAIAQQYFGAGMDRTHLPASWSSTANFNEKIAFLAKDTLLVVDDFAPQPGNIERLHRDADRLLRSQGNRSGRGRMTQSTSLTIAQPPRGLILGTGEDVPRGHSLRGRLFAVAIGKGDIDLVELTQLQALAADGALARSMAGFLDWLRSRFDRLEPLLNDSRVQVRILLSTNGHARNPDQVAHLMFGADAFLVFAFECGAISRDDFLAHRQSIWTALVNVAREQIDLQVGEDPVVQFLSLLNSAVISGSVYLEPQPSSPSYSTQESSAQANASTPRIGWRNNDGLYLNSGAAFAAVQQLAKKQGTEFPISLVTLRKRLYEAGQLPSVERNTGGKVVSYEPKQQIGGKRTRVLHLRADYADYAESLGRAGQAGRDVVPESPPIPKFAEISEMLGRAPGRADPPPDRHLVGADEQSQLHSLIDASDSDEQGWTEDPDDEPESTDAEGSAS